LTQEKTLDYKEVFPFLMMGSLFVIVDGLALLVIGPFRDAGVVAFQNSNDPFNVVYLFVTIIVFTVIILLISKYFKGRFINIIILGAVAFTLFYVMFPLLDLILPVNWSTVFAGSASLALVYLLHRYPEWYIIDASSVLLGAGSITMLGISLSVRLVIVLLIGMAIYDAISVYKTKHMVSLAFTVLESGLPLMLVVPKSLRYSFVKDAKGLKERAKEGQERNAFFMGLGDIVFPGILVVSAYTNLSGHSLLMPVFVILGTLLGFMVLSYAVSSGKPQAGLPFLCSGAIIGYTIGSYFLFGGFVL
jgi:presenilin-like A22 family membrane protease